MLRSVLPFESLYIARSNSRLNEAVATALQGGSRNPPGAADGLNATRAMINELDAARFDPLLVRNVARNVARAVEMFGSRIDGLVSQTSVLLATHLMRAAPSNSPLATTLLQLW